MTIHVIRTHMGKSQVQADDISCFFHLYQCCNCIREGYQICQAQSALNEAMLAVTNNKYYKYQAERRNLSV